MKDDRPTLADLGIDKKISSLAQERRYNTERTIRRDGKRAERRRDR